MHEKYANYIMSLIDRMPRKYADEDLHQAYIKGLLIGVIASLALSDSKNFDIVKKKLGALNKN